MNPLLEIKKLSVVYKTMRVEHPVLRDVSLTVNPGECVGLIGESGSGKSTLTEAILKTLPFKNGRITQGEIFFKGTHLAHDELEFIGNNIAYIPQDPGNSLDPLFPVITNFTEILAEKKRSHLKVGSSREDVKIQEKMGWMIHGIDLGCYPHELSGGMKQRVLIGLALQSVPELIIADEPTSNLDVTLERQIIEIFRDIKESQHVAFLLATHNLAIAQYFCDRIYVLYQGTIVEEGPAHQIFKHPKHEYTKSLVEGAIGLTRS